MFSMSETVKCPYKEKCSNFPLSCRTCEHNEGKRSYYKPVNPTPYEPYTPYLTPANPMPHCRKIWYW